MRVLITGGAGLIGRAAAVHLRTQGWDVHSIDIASPTEVPDADYTVCDIMDITRLREQMRGCDAIVHMAALRNPFYGPGEEVFRINTVGTFNVFEAAAKEGIGRVVQASSINALGCAWNIADFVVQYFPVDEDHPLYTTDPYSFSKQQVEEIGAYFWRRDGISSIAFRLPGTYPAEEDFITQYLERREKMRRFLDAFVNLPEAERQRQLVQVRQECLAFRATRRLEYPNGTWRIPPPENVEELLWFAYTFDRYNLWASLDVRDAALAIEKALTADFEGSHNLFLSHTHNWLEYPSHTLARVFFPDVTEWKQDVNGAESLVSIKRVRELIGFEPQYALRADHHAETG